MQKPTQPKPLPVQYRSRYLLKAENGLETGLNFINVLCAAFTSAYPISIKKTVKLSIFFTLLGSTGVKAVRRMLMKLSPGVNFINVLRAAFVPVDPKSVKRYWQLDWILTLLGAMSVKAVLRTLMKLSPDHRYYSGFMTVTVLLLLYAYSAQR